MQIKAPSRRDFIADSSNDHDKKAAAARRGGR
jgi:hypothetical protein